MGWGWRGMAAERWPALKIVLTSGFPESKLDDQRELIAGLRLLSKPYRKHDLAQTVREAIGRRKAWRTARHDLNSSFVRTLARFAERFSQILLEIRFAEKTQARRRKLCAGIGETRCQHHLKCRPACDGHARKLKPVGFSRHDDIGEKKDRFSAAAEQLLGKWSGVFGLQNLISEIVEAGAALTTRRKSTLSSTTSTVLRLSGRAAVSSMAASFFGQD